MLQFLVGEKEPDQKSNQKGAPTVKARSEKFTEFDHLIIIQPVIMAAGTIIIKVKAITHRMEERKDEDILDFLSKTSGPRLFSEKVYEGFDRADMGRYNIQPPALS